MTDHLYELASAYIDDEATSQERAMVEADPAAMALVAELRDVMRSLPASPPAPSEQRDAHLVSALAAFDELFDRSDAANGAASPVQPSSVVLLRRRRFGTRMAQAAAIVVLVGGVGAVVARLGDGEQASNNDTSEVASMSSVSAGEASVAEGQAAAQMMKADDEASDRAFDETSADQAERTVEEQETEESNAPFPIPSFDVVVPPLDIAALVTLDRSIDTLRDHRAITCVLVPDSTPPIGGVAFIEFGGVSAEVVTYGRPAERAVVVDGECTILAEQTNS